MSPQQAFIPPAETRQAVCILAIVCEISVSFILFSFYSFLFSPLLPLSPTTHFHIFLPVPLLLLNGPVHKEILSPFQDRRTLQIKSHCPFLGTDLFFAVRQEKIIYFTPFNNKGVQSVLHKGIKIGYK